MSQIFQPGVLGELPRQNRSVPYSGGRLNINLDAITDLVEAQESKKEKEEKQAKSYLSSVSKIEDKVLGISVDNATQAQTLKEIRESVGLSDDYFARSKEEMSSEDFALETRRKYARLTALPEFQELINERSAAKAFRSKIANIDDPALKELAQQDYRSYMDGTLSGYDLTANAYKSLDVIDEARKLATGLKQEMIAEIDKLGTNDTPYIEQTFQRNKEQFEGLIQSKYDRDRVYRNNIDARFGGVGNFLDEVNPLVADVFSEITKTKTIPGGAPRKKSKEEKAAEASSLLTTQDLLSEDITDPSQIESGLELSDGRKVSKEDVPRLKRGLFRNKFLVEGEFNPEMSRELLRRNDVEVTFKNGQKLKPSFTSKVDTDVGDFGIGFANFDTVEGAGVSGSPTQLEITNLDPKKGTATVKTNDPTQVLNFVGKDGFWSFNPLSADFTEDVRQEFKKKTGQDLKITDQGYEFEVNISGEPVDALTPAKLPPLLQQELERGEAADYNTLFSNSQGTDKLGGVNKEVNVTDMTVAEVLEHNKPSGEYATQVGKARTHINGKKIMDRRTNSDGVLEGTTDGKNWQVIAAGPAGKYQMIHTKLKEAVEKGYVSPNDKFTPEVQDQIFLEILENEVMPSENPGEKLGQIWEHFKTSNFNRERLPAIVADMEDFFSQGRSVSPRSSRGGFNMFD